MSELGSRPPLSLSWLGRRPYRETQLLQRHLVEERRAGNREDLLLLLEHEPVYSLGRHTEPGDLPRDRKFYASRGIAVESGPGDGRVTYHGPGQLIAWPILDLRRSGDPHGETGPIETDRFVPILKTAAGRTLNRWRLRAGAIDGLAGIWAGRDGPLPADASAAAGPIVRGKVRKIGSIDLQVEGGITSHGLAINVAGDLAPFGGINPGDSDPGLFTSMAAESMAGPRPARVPPRPEGVGVAFAEELAELLGRRLEALDPHGLPKA